MSVPTHKVPQAEQPQAQTDDHLEKLEEDTLDKQAKSATYRDAHERREHLASLNRRIDVLQSKLDDREIELHIVLPRVAELEQAEWTARLHAGLESVAAGGGALMLSVASFVNEATDEWLKYLLFGAGLAFALLGILGKVVMSFFGWPKRETPD
jgi:hypothetical protein